MPIPWTEKWDERYRSEEFAYGKTPNRYLEEQLSRLTPGSILFPAEGEGRNAVWAAGLGWKVAAFDISAEGERKARQLAGERGVSIDYRVGHLEDLNYPPGHFDALALIYAHFPAPIKSACHRMLDTCLRRGGTIIFEAFSKSHLDYLAKNEHVGGPKDPDDLFSIDELREDFPHYDIIELAETEIELHEGLYHNGTGSVIRFVGRKR